MTAPRKGVSMFANLQAVRAVAAIRVVVFHLAVEAPLLRWMRALLGTVRRLNSRFRLKLRAAQE
jgi:peptidoglycan/LPS O-acetylase OafA/YrhL